MTTQELYTYSIISGHNAEIELAGNLERKITIHMTIP